VTWVYAICDRPDVPPPAPLDAVREGDLLAAVGDPPSGPAVDAMWAHEQVVERIMAERTVLPMRFGTKVADHAALREMLATRQDEFRAALDRVRGCVEVGVRVVQPAEPIAATTGREYLEARLRTVRRADAVHEPLTKLAVEATRRHARGPDELLRAAYLVDRAAVSRFHGAVERLQRANPELAIHCTGPWPPYSFVAGADQ
jgi:Gas vesicle synthesis protein GvpL/GvpF